jgi:hypothetical protein
MIRILGLIFITILLCSCKETKRDRIIRLVSEWEGRTIYYPDSMPLTSYRTDSIIIYNRIISPYTILSYADSQGCISCNLQLPKWKELIEELDSICPNKVTCVFAFNPRDKKELVRLLKRVHFDYLVYIDEMDVLNKLNGFVDNDEFQTFLLDKDNRVVAIGNPIHNPKIKELYLNIIRGKNLISVHKHAQTDIILDKTFVNLKDFEWEQEQQIEFILTNSGDELLVIDDITTSCGCTTVEYSKEPVPIGKSLVLKVKYKAEHPEHFSKTITIYCNTNDAPLHLNISGNAK